MCGKVVVGVIIGISDKVAAGGVVSINYEVAVGSIVGINGKVVAYGIFGSGGKIAVGGIVTVEMGCGSTVVVNAVDVNCPYRLCEDWVVVLLFVTLKSVVCCLVGNRVLAKISKVS